MFVENDYILRQIKQIIRNLASLTNLQTVFDLLSDTINVQDEATVLKIVFFTSSGAIIPSAHLMTSKLLSLAIFAPPS